MRINAHRPLLNPDQVGQEHLEDALTDGFFGALRVAKAVLLVQEGYEQVLELLGRERGQVRTHLLVGNSNAHLVLGYIVHRRVRDEPRVFQEFEQGGLLQENFSRLQGVVAVAEEQLVQNVLGLFEP